MFKMSTIYANTCIQTTTPLHHRWWFRWQWPVLVLYAAALLGTMGWGQRWLVPEYSSAEYAYAGYPLCFRGLLPFFSKMGHWHIVHVTLSSCCRERRQSLSHQRCGHLIRQIWIRWTTASEVCFKRESTARGSMMWRSWKNACWGSGGCWTTPSSRQRLCSGVVDRLNVCVRVNGGHFEHKFWASDFLLCFVCFIDTGFCKCDRYKMGKVLILVWNELLLCLRLSHGMVAT